MASKKAVQHIQPDNHFSPDTSVTVVFGWCLALPLLIVLVTRMLAELHMRHAKRANAEYSDDAVLTEGEIVLHGRIQPEDAPYAVQVTILQDGKETKGKSSWSTHWKEISRDVDAHPFYLDTAQGEVRVEADDRVTVVRDIAGSRTRDIASGTRNRTIVLSAGDKIFARGELVYGLDTRGGRGYRGTGKSLVLRGTDNTPLLLSTESLGERFVRKADNNRFWAKGYVLMTIIMQLSFCTYHLRKFSGETTTAVITRHHTYTTKSKNSTTTHFVLTSQLPDGRSFEDEVSPHDYRNVADQSRVYVRYVPWFSGRERLGLGASASIPLAMIWVLLQIILVITHILTAYAARPWYVAALKETVPGRLPTGPF